MKRLAVLLVLFSSIFIIPSNGAAYSLELSKNIVKRGGSITATWSGFNGPLNIFIFNGDGDKWDANTNAEGSGSQVLTFDDNWELRSDYYVRVEQKSNPSIYLKKDFVIGYPPPEPSITGPADGNFYEQGESIPFNWSDPSGYSIDRYYLRIVSGTNLNNTPIYSNEPTASSDFVSTSGWNAGTYTWSVRAIKNHPTDFSQTDYENEIGWGAYASTRTFEITITTPAPPTLTAPEDNANLPIGENVTFQWENSSDLVTNSSIKVCSTSSMDSDCHTFETGLTQTIVSEAFFDPGETYYWQARSKTENSDWGVYGSTPAWEFQIQSTAPSLVKPKDNESISGPPYEFTWEAVSNAGAYQLKVSTQSDFSTTIVNDQNINDEDTSYSYDAELEEGTTHYWQMRTLNASGTEWGKWSDVESFTAKSASLAAPSMIEPINGEEVNRGDDGTVALKWSQVAGNSGYVLQVDKLPVMKMDTDQTTCRASLGNGSHKWKVGTLNSEGECDNWAEEEEFSIAFQSSKAFLVPLFRGYSSSRNDHIYTTNPAERDRLSEYGYSYEKIEAYISNRPFLDGVPLYRLYSPEKDSHFYTISSSERDNKESNGYNYEGIAGYVYDRFSEYLAPMYHLYNAGDEDHFYTISEFEKDYAIENYSYQNLGVDFYVARNSEGAPLAGKPVVFKGGADLSTGNFVPYQNHVDFANPAGFGLPFVFARTYHSMNAASSGPLGPGWTHGYMIRIVEAGSKAIVKWGNGQTDTYKIQGSDYIPESGVDNKLEKTLNSFILTTPEDKIYTFVESQEENISVGRLVEIKDRNGIEMRFMYDPAKEKLLDHIIDGSGRLYRFHYEQISQSLSAGNRYRLTQITEDNAGGLNRSISFGYDNKGRLKSYTNAIGHTTQYFYENSDIPGLLTKIILPRGNEISAEYDQYETNAYGTKPRIAQLKIGTDGNVNHEIKYQYDTDIGNNVSGTEMTVATGDGTPVSDFSASHDKNYRVGLMQDGKGNKVQFLSYDGDDNPIEIQDKNQNRWYYSYDNANGRLRQQVNPENEMTTYKYDPDNPNNLSKIIAPDGRVVEFGYDSKGNIKEIVRTIDGEEQKTTIVRYDNGLIKTITYPPNNKAGTRSTFRFTYDAYGYLDTVTDPLGNVTDYNYDVGGRLLSKEDPDGVSTTYSYDDLNNVKSATDMLGRTTEYDYDANGNLDTVTDPRQIVSYFDYNELDLVESITKAGVRTKKFDYDSAGRRTKATNVKGESWEMDFDEAGNLKRWETPLGMSDTFPAYYPDGRLKRMQDRTGREITYRYNGANRITDKNIASGYQYDYAYWPSGKLKEIERDGKALGYFEYNAGGQLALYTDPNNQNVTYDYYPGGNLKSITYPGNKTVTYDYDARNLLTSVTDWENRVIHYNYTDGGRLKKITYPNGASVNYEYDQYFRLTQVTNKTPDDTVIVQYTVNTFDELDAPKDVTKTGGIAAPAETLSESYDYDKNNRIESAGSTTFTHNDLGELTSKNENGDTISFTWNEADVAGRLQSITSETGRTKSFKYDGLGNRIATRVDGKTTRYVLDVSGQMANVLAETDENNNVIAYYIHGHGLAARINADDNSARYYHFDRRGNVVALTDGSGIVTDQYSYSSDPFGFNVKKQGATDNPFTFVGRYGVMDEGNDIFYMRARFYDAETGRFLSEDPIGFAGGALNLYEYVGGNPVLGIDPGGLTASCPKTPPDENPKWKQYHGNPDTFHCDFEGYHENRQIVEEKEDSLYSNSSPSSRIRDPIQECFYDEEGQLVDDQHEYSGCQGTANSYNNWLAHSTVDPGGIMAHGLEGYIESRRYSFNHNDHSNSNTTPGYIKANGEEVYFDEYIDDNIFGEKVANISPPPALMISPLGESLKSDDGKVVLKWSPYLYMGGHVDQLLIDDHLQISISNPLQTTYTATLGYGMHEWKIRVKQSSNGNMVWSDPAKFLLLYNFSSVGTWDWDDASGEACYFNENNAWCNMTLDGEVETFWNNHSDQKPPFQGFMNQLCDAVLHKENATINSGYGRDLGYHQSQGDYHAGIDVDANTGDTVYSPIEGIVFDKIVQAGENNRILIEENCGHCSQDDRCTQRVWVLGHLTPQDELEIGDHIYKDDVLGEIRSHSGGDHLHVEVQNRGAALGTEYWCQTNQPSPGWGIASDVNDIFEKTVSPIQAYYEYIIETRSR